MLFMNIGLQLKLGKMQVKANKVVLIRMVGDFQNISKQSEK